MKRLFGSILTLVVLYLLQTTVISKFSIAGITPNVILLIVVFVGYRYGKISGIMMGFLTGLFLDLSEGDYIGFFALLYLLVGYCSGFFSGIYEKEYNVFPLFLIAGADFVLNLMIYISGFLVRNRLEFMYYLVRIILPEMFYTVVVSAFLYKLLSIVYDKIDKKKPEVVEEDKKGDALVD